MRAFTVASTTTKELTTRATRATQRREQLEFYPLLNTEGHTGGIVVLYRIAKTIDDTRLHILPKEFQREVEGSIIEYNGTTLSI